MFSVGTHDRHGSANDRPRNLCSHHGNDHSGAEYRVSIGLLTHGNLCEVEYVHRGHGCHGLNSHILHCNNVLRIRDHVHTHARNCGPYHVLRDRERFHARVPRIRNHGVHRHTHPNDDIQIHVHIHDHHGHRDDHRNDILSVHHARRNGVHVVHRGRRNDVHSVRRGHRNDVHSVHRGRRNDVHGVHRGHRNDVHGVNRVLQSCDHLLTYKLVQHDVHDACNGVASDALVHDGAISDALVQDGAIISAPAHLFQLFNLQVLHYRKTLDDGLSHLFGEH